MPHLDSPITYRCGLTLPNRIAMAPLTNTQSNADGTLHDDELRWMVRRARGGWGLVSTCAAFISEEGHAWNGQLGVATDAHLPGLTRLATALTDAGTIPIVQLHHGGAKADEAPMKLSTVDGDNQRGATEEDIRRVIADFVAAALRSERAGFAGVEIHGANGYILTQFLAPDDNPRTDGYGGDLAGRARFVRETLRAVRAAVSPGFAVGVRLSPVDAWARRGLLLEDGVQVAAWMGEDGADFVHLSLGDAKGPPPHEAGGPVVTTAVRQALASEVALHACGGITTRADADAVLAAGADVAVLGRMSIAHPDWPRESAAAGFAPLPMPWDAGHLRSVEVGPDFLAYISKFPGFVAGGAAARG
ncbi:MAG: NADH:flavin oxidoreductase [Deltaproteobacteria bacterium]|nr:NADH:flavin oxidoreductase [Deltaproteobacteria bacterium]